ncbi:hypothetical protein IMSAGC021_01675 [Muribaculaceae bacterium]|nr:hypothetical protein IMSAGC021_01675 [Muribaculaceae bacterium]
MTVMTAIGAAFHPIDHFSRQTLQHRRNNRKDFVAGIKIIVTVDVERGPPVGVDRMKQRQFLHCNRIIAIYSPRLRLRHLPLDLLFFIP